MKYEYKSKFAEDIIRMMEFKQSIGHSLDSYEGNMHRLDTFFLSHYPENDSLTQEMVFVWCKIENPENKSPNRMSTIREFGKYLLSAGKPAYVLPVELSRKYRANLPRILTDNEMINFFKATDRFAHSDNSPLLEYTVATIFRIQYACGLRPKEVKRIRRTDIDYKHNRIYISESKGHKDRRLPVTPYVMSLCQKYDAIARHFYPDSVYFFPSRSGELYGEGWLDKTFRKCWVLSGNGYKINQCTPYDLRHNFATRTLMDWVEKGFDINAYLPYLSAYMGHESFSSTFYYIHLLPERLSNMSIMDVSKIITGGGK